MTTHWTYDSTPVEDLGDLQQGDILRRTDHLNRLLSEVHRHFTLDKYVAFVVLSQTCDLVRRKASCKTPHITLCVVRELEGILPQLLHNVCGTPIDRTYVQESKPKAKELLERILNQNEQSLGLFYLHPDPEVGIAVPSVAQLRVSISLRSEHYDLLKSARSGRICDIFASKLGWLTGNLFSRVATPDWSDRQNGRDEFNQILSALLSRNAAGPIDWISGDLLTAANKKKIDISQLDREAALDRLRALAPAPAKQRAIARIKEIAQSLLVSVGDEQISKLARRLENDSEFSQCCK